MQHPLAGANLGDIMMFRQICEVLVELSHTVAVTLAGHLRDAFLLAGFESLVVPLLGRRAAVLIFPLIRLLDDVTFCQRLSSAQFLLDTSCGNFESVGDQQRHSGVQL